MQKEVSDWFEQAQSDLKAAQNSLNSKNFDWACFQAQQAAEKGIKALILKKENRIIKTHDLVFLGERINLPDSFKDICKELTVVYAAVRYPGSGEIRDIKQKSQKYISFVGDLLTWIKKQLS
ncbi:MAG: HEPN domain-containing protein [Nanoarchaeota archaeon]|nr:HEPN domain-containing protein [Nanoarchaeota archaeon]MBU1631805.1 HEPN domain-containing protein [Nanoarchaeota archaeon]MBU1876597.1 HEPN domain-containing protein [Nanoarchaeota archaeon]